jgi:ribonuclease HI
MTQPEIYPEINLYSDGGAEPNPGKGGFGTILSYKGQQKEFSQGFVLTTNNRMELMGVIHGLRQLKKRSIVHVFSDSAYVVNGISEGWAARWKSNGWYRNKTEKATNADLWELLLDLIASQETVTFNWIKGHNGHPENERCDELAMLALKGDILLPDEGYQASLSPTPGSPGRETNSKFAPILNEGDPCRKCNTAVVKQFPKKKAPKPGQTYYFAYYLYCPGCKTIYHLEEAKREIVRNQEDLFG